MSGDDSYDQKKKKHQASIYIAGNHIKYGSMWKTKRGCFRFVR